MIKPVPLSTQRNDTYHYSQAQETKFHHIIHKLQPKFKKQQKKKKKGEQEINLNLKGKEGVGLHITIDQNSTQNCTI